jgi:hypothetical protein
MKPRSRYSVHGPRHAVSTTARVFGTPPSDAEAPEAPMDLDFPSGPTDTGSVAAAKPRHPSWGLTPLQRRGQGGPLTRASRPGLFRLQGFPPS